MDFKVSKYSLLQYLKNSKSWTELARRGLQNIKKLKVGLFGEKKISEKNLTMPKKVEWDPLGFFNIHFVAKHQKIEGKNLW